MEGYPVYKKEDHSIYLTIHIHINYMHGNQCTVKPLITNTSDKFIKCRLDNFSMSFILYYTNFSICENK